MHRANRVEAAGNRDGLVVIPRQCRFGIVVHGQIARYLVQVGAEVQQPPVLEHREIVQPGILVRDADDDFGPHHLAQPDGGGGPRTALLEAADVGKLG